MDSNQRIDYLYKEYARLNEKVEEHIKGGFEDFKLLGATGATIILWKPISELITLTNPKVDQSRVLFLGFLSLLLVVTLIALMNLVRQSYVYFIVSNLQGYEEEIRKGLDEVEHSRAFTFNLEKETTKYFETHLLPFGAIVIISAVAVTLIPFTILFYSNIFHAVAYLLIALIVSVSYVQLYRRLIKHFSKKVKFF